MAASADVGHPFPSGKTKPNRIVVGALLLIAMTAAITYAIAQAMSTRALSIPACCVYNTSPTSGYKPNGTCVPRPPGAACIVPGI